MVEISNSWVYGLPREKTFIPFLVWNTLIFGPSTLEKDTKKLPMSFFEILHEARESSGSKTDRANLFLFFEKKNSCIGENA